MTIQAAGMVGDPQLMIDMALLDQSHDERNVARTQRYAAQQTEQHELAAEEGSMREAATARLIGGLIQGAGQIAQGACTLGESAQMAQQAAADHKASDLGREAEQATRDNDPVAHDRSASLQATVQQHSAMFQAQARADSGWAEMGNGAATIGSNIATYAGSAADADAKNHERLAGAARSETDDLRGREQDANARAERTLGRIGDQIRERAQTLASLSSNFRA